MSELAVIVPVVGLLDEYASIRTEIERALSNSVSSSDWYILGQEVAALRGGDPVTCVGVTSGTDAIQLALMACGVGPGDEVITVSHTAVATATGVTLVGASPSSSISFPPPTQWIPTLSRLRSHYVRKPLSLHISMGTQQTWTPSCCGHTPTVCALSRTVHSRTVRYTAVMLWAQLATSAASRFTHRRIWGRWRRGGEQVRRVGRQGAPASANTAGSRRRDTSGYMA